MILRFYSIAHIKSRNNASESKEAEKLILKLSNEDEKKKESCMFGILISFFSIFKIPNTNGGF